MVVDPQEIWPAVGQQLGVPVLHRHLCAGIQVPLQQVGGVAAAKQRIEKPAVLMAVHPGSRVDVTRPVAGGVAGRQAKGDSYPRLGAH